MQADAIRILRLIDKHSGKWNWYQLARSDAGIELSRSGRHLMRILDSLISSRYIETTEGPNPSQPNYVITQLGRDVIAAAENDLRTT
jgi:hypothetical protein